MAELEATTVRKGNKKVSVTLSGWVVKSFNLWDDGSLTAAFVGDKGYDLGSRFAITGSATIAPGWSAGFNLTMLTTGDLFATSGTLASSISSIEVNSRFGYDLREHQPALLVHLHQERHVGHPELGSFEPSV